MTNPAIESNKSEGIKLPFLITTTNLIIRPLVKEDKNVVSEAIHESLQNLHMWLPWAEATPSPDDYITVCQKFYDEAQSKSAYHFVVYQNETFMGMCSLSDIDLASNTARLGYWCRTSTENEGYFTEAMNAILRYGFENAGMKEFYIPCIVGNFVSEIAAKNLNFRLNKIDIIQGQQIKIFKIANTTTLPALANFLVVN